MPREYSIGLIGSGKLARSLLLNPVEGYVYKWVLIRSAKSKISLKEFLAGKIDLSLKLLTNIDAGELPDIIFLAVNDSNIEEVAEGITEIFGDKLRNKHIVHFSGIQTAEILCKCREKGAFLHKIHPFQTFFYPEPGVFSGIYWGVQSIAENEPIKDFIKKSGGAIINLDGLSDEELIKYHASAVIASNFSNTLIAYSRKLVGNIGISSEILLPIVGQTIKNAFRGEEFPLTGPIARGDTETVKKHIIALSHDKMMQEFYLSMSLAALSICAERGLISESKRKEFLKLLGNFRGKDTTGV